MSIRKRAALQQEETEIITKTKIGKPSPPLVTRNYTDNTNRNQLDYRLNVDYAKIIGISITSLEELFYPPLDSRTAFNSKTSNVEAYKSETGFFPGISQPPSNSVCKYYLDFLLDLKSDLEINHIFCHSVFKEYFIKSPKLFG